MSDMKIEQLQPGQGALALGATHGENTTPQSAELNAGGQASHEENARGGSAMYLRGLAEGEHGTSQFGATPQVEHAGGQAEMGGGGEGYTEDEMRQMRQWRKEQILSGAANLDGEIRAIKDRVGRGEILSKPETFRLRDGSTVEGTLGDRIRGLLLARLIFYPTAKEAALALRENEGIVRQEIDEYQVLEGAVGASSRPLVTGLKAGGVPYTEGNYFTKLFETQKLIETPPELQEFRKTLETLGKEYGNEYLRRMAKRFRRHELVGLMPTVKDLPLFVPFEKAMKELRRLAPEGDGRSLVDEIKAMEEMAEEERMRQAKELGLGMARQEIGGEYYIGMYQEAWDEFCEALITFPPEIQDEIIANYVIGGSIMGGQYPAFYRKGVEQRGRFPSKWTPWLNAIEHFQKTSSIEGYIPPEQIFQALGSVKPEVLAFPDFHTSRHEIWLAGEDKPRKFSLSSRDMIGQLGRIDTLARMGANNAYTSETGFFAVRNGEFAEYLFRQMGFSPEEARKIAYEKAEAPTLVRDSRLSPTRRREITNIWDWVGETALDKLIVPMAWLKYSRADLEFVPLDVKRRQILSMRGLELADYRLVYSLGLPNEQFLNMIALFPSAISIDHKEMLSWIRSRMSDKKIGGEENASIREDVWKRTITLNRPSLASTRHLARMAMGLGKYNKTGSSYREAIHVGVKNLPKNYFPALLHPDLWKNRWFNNANEDPSQWEYVGNLVDGPELTEIQQAFQGYDFTDELRACGLSENEIQALKSKNRLAGFDGWKSLLQRASLGLLEWKKLNYTTGDKTWRYEAKKEKAQDATVAFLETSNPYFPESFDHETNVNNDAGQLADIEGQPAIYHKLRSGTSELNKALLESQGTRGAIKEAFEKLIQPVADSLGFVTNRAQQAYLRAVVWMFLEGHAAHRLESYVEDIEFVNPEDGKDQFGGGVNFSVKLLRKGDIDKGRIEELLGEGFNFIHRTGSEGIEGKEIVISPLGAPLPKLIKAKELLANMKSHLGTVSGEDKDHAVFILNAIKLMEDKGAFCWDTLVNGAADITPAIIISALNELKEEGALTSAAKRAIVREALRFYKIHPDKGAKLTEKNSVQFSPVLTR